MNKVERFIDQENLHNTEGHRGIQNLCRLVNAIGYKDPYHSGQMAPNSCTGDLHLFLEDNPGAIEALQQWIVEQADKGTDWNDNVAPELMSEVEGTQTTICNTSMLSPDDGLEQEDIDVLVEAEANGTPVTVECEATDGYFDVNINGHQISALSGYHLACFAVS